MPSPVLGVSNFLRSGFDGLVRVIFEHTRTRQSPYINVYSWAHARLEAGVAPQLSGWRRLVAAPHRRRRQRHCVAKMAATSRPRRPYARRKQEPDGLGAVVGGVAAGGHASRLGCQTHNSEARSATNSLGAGVLESTDASYPKASFLTLALGRLMRTVRFTGLRSADHSVGKGQKSQ